MLTLIKNISSLVTIASNRELCKNGIEMSDIEVIKDGAMLFDEAISWIGSSEEAEQLLSSAKISPDNVLNYHGKTILPGFVDSHTHLVFAGNRSGEFSRRLRGVTYQQIASEGGGILHTVEATRKASITELKENAKKLALSAIAHGTTAFEIKSGYGLSLEAELKQLRAIRLLKDELPVHISSTFLGAHDFPPEYANSREAYIDLICNEMIPAVASENLAEFCDAFIDKGYYSIEQGRRIFETALKYGLKIKAHADELADTGSANLAGELGAVSADHLLFVSDQSLDSMKKAGTIAALLPGTAYFIRMQYAPARKIIDKDLVVALATDCNPGSCFIENMQFILSLAVINMRMTAEEALTAATLNGAAAIGQSGRLGSLEPGKQADFIALNSESYTDLFYHAGINHIEQTWIKGRRFS